MGRNVFKYKNRRAFHPGYYIKEYIDYNGFTQEDFAERLGTTPKNLSILIRGEQGLSLDIALKLSRVTATSVEYWLNHQKAYDTLVAEAMSDRMAEEDEKIIRVLGYSYFRDNFSLEELPRKLSRQGTRVREILDVSSLSILGGRKNYPMRTYGELGEENIIRANAMVYLARNATVRTKAPRYDCRKFAEAVKAAALLTTDYSGFVSSVRTTFRDAGVILTVLPSIPGSRLRGASLKVGKKVMLMVSDRNTTADGFSFTLMHEASHILQRDWGLSIENGKGRSEVEADRFSEDTLIPPDRYSRFFISRCYDRESVLSFVQSLSIDPGIVVSRLQKDGVVRYDDIILNGLKHKYEIDQDLSICISPFALKSDELT